ncbi:hypothetical protein CsSME_00050948 [Camellia sinensis var. sinensis]
MDSLSRNSLSSNLLSLDKANGNNGGKSSEETDYLIRSTKKIKGANVEDDDTMLDNLPFDDNLDDLSTDDEFEDDGDEIDEAESSVTEVQGIPRISLPKKLLAKIRRPWNDCLIIKLLGKRDLQGDFEAIDLDSGFFLIKFQMKEDYAYFYTGGPWIVLDHYLTEVKTTLWVRFP